MSQVKEMVYESVLLIQNLKAYVPMYGIQLLMTRVLLASVRMCEQTSTTPLGLLTLTASIKLANINHLLSLLNSIYYVKLDTVFGHFF